MNTFYQLSLEMFPFYVECHGMPLIRYSTVPPSTKNSQVSDHSFTHSSCDPSLFSIYREKETYRYPE